MNKAELVEALAARFDGNKAEAARALAAVLETVTEALASGDRVAVAGFGVFEAVARPARMVRNPATGERKEAPATTVPRFRPGSDLKASVAQGAAGGARRTKTTKTTTAAKATKTTKAARTAAAATAATEKPARRTTARTATAKTAGMTRTATSS